MSKRDINWFAFVYNPVFLYQYHECIIVCLIIICHWRGSYQDLPWNSPCSVVADEVPLLLTVSVLQDIRSSFSSATTKTWQGTRGHEAQARQGFSRNHGLVHPEPWSIQKAQADPETVCLNFTALPVDCQVICLCAEAYQVSVVLSAVIQSFFPCVHLLHYNRLWCPSVQIDFRGRLSVQ